MASPSPVGLASQADWERWLKAHHRSSDGLWLLIAKKASGTKSVSYPEALDSALCYGWIDSQRRTVDAASWMIRMTPRGKDSLWSSVNTKHVARLIKEGRMRPAGLAAVAEAKKNGRWTKAYEGQSSMGLPPDFLRAIAMRPKAKAFLATLNRANLYAIAWRLRTAGSPELRERRLLAILERLEAKRPFH